MKIKMTNWQNHKLSDVVKINQNTLSKKDKLDSIVYLDTGNMIAGKISDLAEYAIEKAPSRAKRKVQHNSIVYSMVRPNQLHYGLIKNPKKNFIVSTGFAVIDCLTNIADSRFIYYWLTQSDITEFLQGIAENSTSAYPAIRPEDLGNLEISLPPIAEQRKIAAVLGALDDKIELNNKINNNLEQQAQALFKSWFIDKEYEIEKNTTLGDVCKCELGGTPSRMKPEYWNGNIAWINSGEVNNFRIIKASEYITETGLQNSSTKLLPKKTTVIAITGATLGQISLLEINSCANQSVVGILENEILPYEFIYPYTCYNMKELLSHQTGGAQQHINKQNVEQLALSLPKQIVIKEYKNIVSPIFELIAKNCFENEKLAALRDTLLPKLMKGEIDVSKVDISSQISTDKLSLKQDDSAK